MSSLTIFAVIVAVTFLVFAGSLVWVLHSMRAEYRSFDPVKMWRVLGPSGELWIETHSEKEARAALRDGDILEQMYAKVQREWRREVT